MSPEQLTSAATCGALEGFSRWHPLDAVAQAPVAPGVVQVKVRAGLIEYPRGKSAMLLYGADEDLRAFVETAGPELLRRARAAGHPDVVFRTHALDDPGAALAAHLGRFVQRFGAAPLLHT